MKSRFYILMILFFYGESMLVGQEVIQLKYPSFEDAPHIGTLNNRGPRGWKDCGFPGESPPDVQPNLDPFTEPFFGVTKRAIDGDTYIGMTVRNNGTYEAVGQQLEAPLQSGKNYAFSIYLARSNTYVSLGRSEGTMNRVNYIEPAKLKIYGGNDYCQKEELLGESNLVDHYEWEDYEFVFSPRSDHEYILFEAYYESSKSKPYCGHILLDHCSNIVEISMEEANRMKYDLENATLEELDTLLLGEVASLSDKDISIKVAIYNHVYQFEKSMTTTGLRQFILNDSNGEVSKTIRCLEAMNIQVTLGILKKAAAIFKKTPENRLPAEITYFEEVDELMLEKINEEDLTQKRFDYLLKHKKSLILELTESR